MAHRDGATANVTSGGRSFNMWAPETGKARLPTEVQRKEATFRRLEEADLSLDLLTSIICLIHICTP